MEVCIFVKKRRTLETFLFVVGHLLVITTVTMAEDNFNTNSTGTSGAQGCQPSVCTSRDCVIVASRMASLLDPQSDPCQDFAKYACGGFYEDAVIPDDKPAVAAFDSLTGDIERLLRNFMSASINKDDHEYVKKVKRLYSTCMNEDEIEEIGLKPYTTSDYVKDWPTLNPSWDYSTYDVNDLIQKYIKDDVTPLFKLDIGTDLYNSTKQLLIFNPPDFDLLPVGYYTKPRNDTVMMALQQYYVDVAVALGAVKETAQRDANEFVVLQRVFAKISKASGLRITTLDKMGVIYPYVDWHGAIQARFDLIDYTVPKNLPVYIRKPKYFNNLILGEMLKRLSSRPKFKRAAQNYFGFTYAVKYVGSLTKQMRELKFKFTKTYTGLEKDAPSWRRCVEDTSSVFPDAVGKEFVTEMFSEDSKKYMNTMVANLKESFSGMLREADWMAQTTKEAASVKVDALVVKIGYPDKAFSFEDIERKYENYTIREGEFYNTIRYLRIQTDKKSLKNLIEPVNRDEFAKPLWEINAYNHKRLNEIGFPAGLLQPPIYWPQSPSSISYGGIGSLVGHEITHGFTKSGSQIDYQGNFNNWWQYKDMEEYRNRTQCVIDQYSAIWLDEIDMFADGETTVGDDVADIGGLKESYRAYKTYAASRPDEIPLPGLGLTPDKQFFLSFAQMYCEKRTPSYVKSRILNKSHHSPPRLRILVPLQDNEDFARVFQCPTGSPMNPAKKCVVW